MSASSASLVKRLTGTMTALVTPMHADGSIDFEAIDRLVDRQCSAGIKALVVNGSTAEAITLSPKERRAILSRIVSRTKGQVLIIAGTGQSSTQATLEEHNAAKDLGADAGLVVTPAYNRPSDEGIWRHYQYIHNASDLPILLYNVPSRTGRDMSVALLTRLATLERVVGLKDANADLTRVAALRRAIAKSFALLSGDDNTAAAYCAIGGDGLISVASNARPRAMQRLIEAAKTGQRDKILLEAQQLMPLLDALGLDSNPIPIKAAVAIEDNGSAHYRLPLCAASTDTTQKIRESLIYCAE